MNTVNSPGVQTPPELNQKRLRTFIPYMTNREIDLLIEVLPMDSVNVITPPASGLIMAKVKDCFDVDFFLGEILVTRTEVEYGDRQTQVTIMGNLPKHALVAATLELLEKNGEASAFERALAACQPAIERIEKAIAAEAQLTAATRVHFESMAEEP